MIDINNKASCCGCAACEQICPKHSIKMENDSEGFWYPKVESEQCIKCGLCEKVCPILTTNNSKQCLVQTYIGYSMDPSRDESSSGGIFTLAAEEVLNKQGIVFGAAFDDTFMVHHISVSKVENLGGLRGSKYLQSRIENTYQEAEDVLKQGRLVLFSGTACQIAGLKGYLRKDYENLFTIDVLCHGVPSPRLWEKYLEEQEETYNAQARRIFFRHKKYGWKTYSLLVEFSNGKEYECVHIRDTFMYMFLSNICLRPSCHTCKFKELGRPSDITLGDCWGIENYIPEMDDNRGTSIILIHSEKGNELICALSKRMHMTEADVDKALPPTADSRKSVMAHSNRDKFFQKMNKGQSLESLLHLVQPSFAIRVKRKCKKILKKAKKIVTISGRHLK